MNVDANQGIATRFGVQSIPTFIMFRSGRVVDKMMGATLGRARNPHDM